MTHTPDEELIVIRTQLTVALLAVALLQRKHAHSWAADRLMAQVDTALQRISRAVSELDAVLAAVDDRGR